jgi:hypothetical protein
MTFESGLPGWLACTRRKEAATKPKRSSRRHRPHAGLVLELALLLVLAALLPRGKKRK